MTKDHSDRVKLFVIGDVEPAIDPEQAKAVEPLVVRQPPFEAYTDDMPELEKTSAKPLTTRTERSTKQISGSTESR
jgi:hypothetical protein